MRLDILLNHAGNLVCERPNIDRIGTAAGRTCVRCRRLTFGITRVCCRRFRRFRRPAVTRICRRCVAAVTAAAACQKRCCHTAAQHTCQKLFHLSSSFSFTRFLCHYLVYFDSVPLFYSVIFVYSLHFLLSVKQLLLNEFKKTSYSFVIIDKTRKKIRAF